MPIKKRHFYTLYFAQRKFFNSCVLSQWIVHRINSQNIYTFTFQEALLQTFLLLVLKIVKNLQRIFKITCNPYSFSPVSFFLFIICFVILVFSSACPFFSSVYHQILIHFVFRVHRILVICIIFNKDLIFDSWNIFRKKNFLFKIWSKFFLL